MFVLWRHFLCKNGTVRTVRYCASESWFVVSFVFRPSTVRAKYARRIRIKWTQFWRKFYQLNRKLFLTLLWVWVDKQTVKYITDIFHHNRATFNIILSTTDSFIFIIDNLFLQWLSRCSKQAKWYHNCWKHARPWNFQPNYPAAAVNHSLYQEQAKFYSPSSDLATEVPHTRNCSGTCFVMYYSTAVSALWCSRIILNSNIFDLLCSKILIYA